MDSGIWEIFQCSWNPKYLAGVEILIPEFSLTNPESRKRGNPESKFYGQ